MSSLPLELPVLQNWSCHSCGGCCRQHGIFITEAEKQRIEKQGWTEADGIPPGQPIFVRMGGWFGKKWHRLAHQPDGACVFLNEQGLCRIHAKFGEPAKPLACRIYPYAFHPAGGTITVGLRFSCPSVVANRGRAVAEQERDIRDLARQVVPAAALKAPPPALAPGSRVEWTDFHLFLEALDAILGSELPFWQRLIACNQLADLIERSRFQKIRGDRLQEFLSLVLQGIHDELPDELESIPAPGAIGRTQFRLLAGQYARKDSYGSNDGGWKGRLGLLSAALRLTRGSGRLPSLQPCLPEMPFERLETPFGVPEGSEALFERYFRVKLSGLSFCGRAYYNASLVEGFRSLTLVYPAVLWIGRWLAAGQGETALQASHVEQALAIADHHHGYSPAFGTWGFRKRVQTLARQGEIPRLCAWYSR